ncbi:hypothetical protein [Coleofasciculus sp. E1-EBD-02]|uniref:hypothetical protein n=1 Tax=Coleofasciculus sp. E1-EBD-02 TaxID=3068481 RepID=UPI0032FC215A
MRNLFTKAFGAEKLDVGAGLGTKFRYSPITEQQNPPSPPITEQQNPPSSPITEQQNPPISPPKDNRLIPNWTTKPTLF